jgi:hypothetical protein
MYLYLNNNNNNNIEIDARMVTFRQPRGLERRPGHSNGCGRFGKKGTGTLLARPLERSQAGEAGSHGQDLPLRCVEVAPHSAGAVFVIGTSHRKEGQATPERASIQEQW